MSAPSILRPSQLAAEMGIAVRTLWRYRAEGLIPKAAIVRVGKSDQPRYKRSVLVQAGLLPAVAP